MVIMVSGACGYIGRHVVATLVNRHNTVLAVDMTDSILPSGLRFLKGDILHDSSFVAALPVPDVFLHLAWQDGFKHNAASHLMNLGAHFELIKTVAERGCRHIAVMGTMHEVGYHEGAISDGTPCNPLSLYGIAKNALREALQVEFAQKPVCFQWLRGYYIYGDDSFNHSIFTKLLKAAQEGKKSFPFTSGKNKYDFVRVEDLAWMIASAILQTKIDGIINCCSGQPQALGEVVEKFIADNRLDLKLDYGAFPDRPYDSPGVWGDASKIRAILEG